MDSCEVPDENAETDISAARRENKDLKQWWNRDTRLFNAMNEPLKRDPEINGAVSFSDIKGQGWNKCP